MFLQVGINSRLGHTVDKSIHKFSRSRGVEEAEGEEATVGEAGGLADELPSMDNER